MNPGNMWECGDCSRLLLVVSQDGIPYYVGNPVFDRKRTWKAVILILKEIYYIVIYDNHGNRSMSTPEQDTFPTNGEIEAALIANGGYAAKIDKRFKLA